MAKLTTYAILVFMITISLYFVGFQSPLMDMVNSVGTDESIAQSFINELATSFTDSSTLAKVGVGAGIVAIAGTFLSGAGSSFVLYAVPLIFISFFLNFFIFPISAVASAGLPAEVTWFVVLLLNILVALGIMEFTRGGGA